MKPQVDKNIYTSPDYIEKRRFLSFFYQISLINEIKPSNLLEIGVGNNIIKNTLPENSNYHSLDIDSSLEPSIVGNVVNIGFKENSFDLVACFQVLEHLPYSELEKCLSELSRVSRKNVLLSLPHANFQISFDLKISGLNNIRFFLRIPKFFEKHKFLGEHYWELGKKGYSVNRIKKSLRKYFKIKKIFRPFENNYHMFFVLEKR